MNYAVPKLEDDTGFIVELSVGSVRSFGLTPSHSVLGRLLNATMTFLLSRDYYLK